MDELPLLAVSRAPPWVTDGADAGGGAPDGTLLLPPPIDEAGAIVAGVAVLLVLLLSGFVGVSVEPAAVVGAFATVEDDATLAEPVEGDAALAPEVEAAEEEPFCPARMGAKVLVDTWMMSLPWTVRLSFDFLSSRVRVSAQWMCTGGCHFSRSPFGRGPHHGLLAPAPSINDAPSPPRSRSRTCETLTLMTPRKP